MRLDADQPHLVVVDEAGEEPDRVRAAADTGDGDLRQPLLGLLDLIPGLVADHRLELADDLRVGVRPDARADQVVRRLDIRDPVPDRLARRLPERLRAEVDRSHLGAEQVHALDVRRLPLHVLGAHVDHALEAEAGADGRRRDAVLAAPVSATIRRLPSRWARSAWPRVLLSLCAPVWRRSSRLR